MASGLTSRFVGPSNSEQVWSKLNTNKSPGNVPDFQMDVGLMLGVRGAGVCVCEREREKRERERERERARERDRERPRTIT